MCTSRDSGALPPHPALLDYVHKLLPSLKTVVLDSRLLTLSLRQRMGLSHTPVGESSFSCRPVDPMIRINLIRKDLRAPTKTDIVPYNVAASASHDLAPVRGTMHEVAHATSARAC